MLNEFTYFPSEKIYHIHLGKHGNAGNTIVCQEGFDKLDKHIGIVGIMTSGYARITINREAVPLHRFLMNQPQFLDIDHINKNKLDNRIINLRVCSRVDNLACSGLSKTNSSGYRGVYWCRANQNWKAQICVSYKRISLGAYQNKNEAAIAYNIASKKSFGEFAYQNIIKD